MRFEFFDNSGQSAVEYAVLISLLSVASVLGLNAMGVSVGDVLCASGPRSVALRPGEPHADGSLARG